MNIDYYKNLEILYNALESSAPTIHRDERMNAIAAFIHQNAEELASDLSRNSAHAQLYQKITAALGSNTTPQLIKDLQTIHTDLTAIADSVNKNGTPLKDLNMSIEELKRLAPLLEYVNCHDLEFKDTKEIEDFVKNCSSAVHLFIKSNKIITLNQLPKTLQTLDCDFSTGLKTIDCSNCPGLQSLSCYGCLNLEKLDCSNCQGLQRVDCRFCINIPVLQVSNSGALRMVLCNNCSKLKEIDYSNCQSLKNICCNTCANLKEINCSNCGALNAIDCMSCPSLIKLDSSNCHALESLTCSYTRLRELKLSNSQALKWIDCHNCPNLKEIDCSNCQALEGLNCSTCRNLETIISTGLPNCTMLDHSECPLLTQLPQLPPGINVLSYNSIDFVSFTVDPEDLNTKPLEVLNHLGEIISRDKRMPNIVYLNSPGLDAGGLRRQLVTTLMKNLFPAAPIEAYKTIGMLIALAALGSLPLGRLLKNNFFFALLHTEKDTPEKKIQSLALYGVPDEEIETVDPSITRPIAEAAKGFREITDPKKFREMPLNDFVNRVAGLEVNWDNFNNLCVYKGPDEEKIRGYFKTFFEKNPLKATDVVELITSSRALGEETIKIIVEDTLDKNKLFSMNTCFQQVKLPSYDTYEWFEAKLLKTIEYTLTQFGKA